MRLVLGERALPAGTLTWGSWSPNKCLLFQATQLVGACHRAPRHLWNGRTGPAHPSTSSQQRGQGQVEAGLEEVAGTRPLHLRSPLSSGLTLQWGTGENRSAWEGPPGPRVEHRHSLNTSTPDIWPLAGDRREPAWSSPRTAFLSPPSGRGRQGHRGHPALCRLQAGLGASSLPTWSWG